MCFLRSFSAWPLRCIALALAIALLGFSSGDLEKEMCVCCSFLAVAQSSCFGGGTDFNFEQNRGGGVRANVLLFTIGGEITSSHRGALLERICSEHLFS